MGLGEKMPLSANVNAAIASDRRLGTVDDIFISPIPRCRPEWNTNVPHMVESL